MINNNTSQSPDYESAYNFFVKTLERIEADLASYMSRGELVKPLYVEKQKSIINAMKRYSLASDAKVNELHSVYDCLQSEQTELLRVLRSMVILCNAAHVSPVLVRAAFNEQWMVADTFQSHCLLCNDPSHQHYRTEFESVPGSILNAEKRNRLFNQFYGIQV